MENLPDIGRDLRKGRKRAIYYIIISFIHFFMHYWSTNIFPNSGFKRFLYLTNMSFYLNMIYYVWMLLTDHGLFHNSKLFSKDTEAAYFKFSYSLSFVVFLMYWGMVIFSNALINAGNPLPIVFDLFMHGANYVLNLLEILFVNHKEDSKRMSYSFYIVFCIFYAGVLQCVYLIYGQALYPFVKDVSFIGFIIICLIAFSLMMIGDLSYKFVHYFKRELFKKKKKISYLIKFWINKYDLTFFSSCIIYYFLELLLYMFLGTVSNNFLIDRNYPSYLTDYNLYHSFVWRPFSKQN
jgi:hypothetical protein